MPDEPKEYDLDGLIEQLRTAVAMSDQLGLSIAAVQIATIIDYLEAQVRQDR